MKEVYVMVILIMSRYLLSFLKAENYFCIYIKKNSKTNGPVLLCKTIYIQTLKPIPVVRCKGHVIEN